jgi:hypothetical protein
MDEIPDEVQLEHEEYIRKCKAMLKEYNIRLQKTDWKELYSDKKSEL